MKYINLFAIALLLLLAACTKDEAIPQSNSKIELISVTEDYTSGKMFFTVESSVKYSNVICIVTNVDNEESFQFSAVPVQYNKYRLDISNSEGFNVNVSFLLTTQYDLYLCPEVFNMKSKDFKVPDVKTVDVIDKAGNPSVTFKGSITDFGGKSITEYGFCFRHGTETPTLDNFVVKADNLSNGNFSFLVNSLESGRTYTVCAYAKNTIGMSYGAPLVFFKQ